MPSPPHPKQAGVLIQADLGAGGIDISHYAPIDRHDSLEIGNSTSVLFDRGINHTCYHNGRVSECARE